MSDKIKVNWVSDSSGVNSCHRNGPGKLKETYLGHIVFVDGKWFSKLKDEQGLRGPHRNMFMAKRDIEIAVNGEQV
jgi:hypothetical protein